MVAILKNVMAFMVISFLITIPTWFDWDGDFYFYVVDTTRTANNALLPLLGYYVISNVRTAISTIFESLLFGYFLLRYIDILKVIFSYTDIIVWQYILYAKLLIIILMLIKACRDFSVNKLNHHK